jgi:hypothetical protein
MPRVANDLLRHACFGVSLMPWGDEWRLVSAKGEHSNRLMSAKVRAFVDHLARRIGRMPYWDKGLLDACPLCAAGIVERSSPSDDVSVAQAQPVCPGRNR